MWFTKNRIELTCCCGARAAFEGGSELNNAKEISDTTSGIHFRVWQAQHLDCPRLHFEAIKSCSEKSGLKKN